MKARTSGAGRTGCEAVQYSDQMQCARCGLSYDVNDPDPPDCQRPVPRTVHKTASVGPTTRIVDQSTEGLAKAHQKCVEELEKLFD